MVGHLAHLHRHRHHEHHHGLEAEDRHQAHPAEPLAVPLAHAAVAEVLPLAPVAQGQVDEQPQAPDGREDDEHVLAQGHAVAIGDHAGHPGHHHEAEPPHGIDDGGVGQTEADDPGQGQEHDDGQGAPDEDLEVEHRTRLARRPSVVRHSPAGRSGPCRRPRWSGARRCDRLPEGDLDHAMGNRGEFRVETWWRCVQ